MKFFGVVKILRGLFSELIEDSAIVGGAARDAYYGIAPKDVDYAVVLKNIFRNEADAFDLFRNLSEVLSVYGIKSEVLQAYGKEAGRDIVAGTFSDRVFGVMRIYADDIVVELLITKRDSIQAMVDEFDTSMNQFISHVNPHDGSTLPQYIGKPEEHIKLVGLKFKTDCRLAINDDRRERMRIKYNKIKEQSSRLYGEILP